MNPAISARTWSRPLVRSVLALTFSKNMPSCVTAAARRFVPPRSTPIEYSLMRSEDIKPRLQSDCWLGHEPEKSPRTTPYRATFLCIRATGILRDRSSPEEHCSGICFEHPDQPFAGTFVPQQHRHSLSDSAPSKRAGDKELVHVVSAFH